MDHAPRLGTGGRPLRLAYLGDPNSVHTRRWIGYFASHGHEVHLLVGSHDTVAEGLPAAVTVHRFRREGRPRLPVLASLDVRRRLRGLLTEIDADVLHAHFLSRYGWLGRVAGWHPYVVTLWGSDILITPWRSWRARIKGRLALVGADRITVASGHIGDAAMRLGARPERIVRIHFGVDTDRFNPTRADPSVRVRLGLSGRIVFSPRALAPLYRHELVLEAVAPMAEDVKVLVGRRRADAAYLDRLRARARELGMTDRFVVLDDIADEDLPALFAVADVVVSVPESDGLPLTVLEAMASAAPVVVSDLPGPRDPLLAHPRLIVPGGDAGALTTALDWVLGLAPAERDALGQALRAAVTGEYEYVRNMQAMEQVYRALVPDLV